MNRASPPRRVQNVAVNSVLLAGAAAGTACYMGYTNPEQLAAKVKTAADTVDNFGRTISPDDNDKPRSKLRLSRLFAKHAALTGSFATGAALGFRVG